MNYRSAVAEGKRLIKRSEEDQWRLAELTYEVVSDGKSRRQWAEDLGVHHSYTARLYQIWARRDVDNVDSFPKAYEAVGGGRPKQPTRPEDRVEMARKLLRDKQVADSVVRDVDTMAVVARAQQDRSDQADRTRGKSPLGKLAEEFDISVELYKARKHIVRALETAKSRRLTKAQTNELLEDLDDLETAVGWFTSFLRDGDKSWEEALAEWAGESR